MSLETASYISGLNASNPPAGDPVANAADHLRLIKSVLQTTFPNLTAAVTSTALQLTYGVVPTSGIIMWGGALTAIPTGWALCDGTSHTSSDGTTTIATPDLRDRFVIGAGDAYAVGATGGATTFSNTSGATALSVAQIPPIGIGISDPGHNHYVNDPGHAHTYQKESPYAVAAGNGCVVSGTSTTSPATSGSGTGIWLNASGTGISAYTEGTNGWGHTHTISGSIIPPYYALAYIMKL